MKKPTAFLYEKCNTFQTKSQPRKATGFSEPCAGCADAEALNKLLATVESPTLQHYFNSKLICYQVLDKRAAGLGLKRNPMTKKYEAAAA